MEMLYGCIRICLSFLVCCYAIGVIPVMPHILKTAFIVIKYFRNMLC